MSFLSVSVICIIIILQLQSGAAHAQSANNSTLNSLWTVRSEFDGIVLYQSSIVSPGIACGFAQPSLCETCGIFFSVFMLGSSSQTLENVHIVWAANRNKPVSLNATLKLEQSGNLVLRDADGSIVWESRTAGMNVTLMKLDPNGNLLLLNSSGGIVWQSFKTPTDSLVIDQELGVGDRLISSESETNVSEGRFYLEVEPDRVSLKHESGQRYGEWCVLQQRGVSRLRLEPGKIVCYDRDGGEAGSIRTPQSENPSNLTSFNQFVRLLPDGNLKGFLSEGDVTAEIGTSLMQWFLEVNVPDCAQAPAACGDYGICTRNGDCSCSFEGKFTPIDPTNMKKGCLIMGKTGLDKYSCLGTEMVKLEGMNTQIAAQGFLDGNFASLDLDQCKASCLSNCSCAGLVYQLDRCFQLSQILTVWNATLYDESSSEMYLKLPSDSDSGKPEAQPPDRSPQPQPGMNKNKNRKRAKIRLSSTAYIVGSILLGTAAVLVVAVVKICRAKFSSSPSKHADHRDLKSFARNLPNSPRLFDYSELCRMSSNFKTAIGRGAFGTVFEGELTDGTRVAIKRLESARHALKQFETEVRTIGSVRHKNLVNLQGYGYGADQMNRDYYYLVYDFVENLSLDQWLFKQKKQQDQDQDEEQEGLSWERRIKIAVDIASGLDYLHRGCNRAVLHLDIKPQNILLDANFQAKICDFGLAKLLEKDAKNSFFNTTVRGTPGYMAPEWLHSRVTSKTDVYSFGIVLLELISGKKAVPIHSTLSNLEATCTVPVARIKDFKRIETLRDELVDERLKLQIEEKMEQVKQVAGVALLCVEQDPLQRPTMADVLKMLEQQQPAK